MSRPTRIFCDTAALMHNVGCIKQSAPQQKIMAMVKANAYGCGIENVIPFLDGHVDLLGVASLEEAIAIRRLGVNLSCVLLQGFFSLDELHFAAGAGFQCVVHHRAQLELLLANPLAEQIRIWIKVNTGMNRLGFLPHEVPDILSLVSACSWISHPIGVMTHFAAAEAVGCPSNFVQLQRFNELDLDGYPVIRSLANSAAILSMKETHADVVRPGIMLYGISPFPGQTGQALGLKPVMRFVSAISAIHHYPAQTPVGYGGTWVSDRPSVIGVIPVGYADGYPRRIRPGTPVWVNGTIVPVVGRISMDMLTVDLTSCSHPQIGDPVELWGQYIPVEVIAESAGTIAYELLTKVTPRARDTAIAFK